MRWLKYLTVFGSLAALIFSYHRAKAVIQPVQIAATTQCAEDMTSPQTRIEDDLFRAGVARPKQLALLAFKAEKRLELYASAGTVWVHVKDYPILAASGQPGPKLREGDKQVPEGVYQVVALNNASAYHLSLKLDYPNAFDRQKAKLEKRTRLGGEICIHGKDVSIGCIAVGDTAIEEIFHIASKAGAPNVKIIIAPNDLRCSPPVTPQRPDLPWLPEFYRDLKTQLRPFVKA
jgi:murein L,D-transpeptidase YafK